MYHSFDGIVLFLIRVRVLEALIRIKLSVFSEMGCGRGQMLVITIACTSHRLPDNVSLMLCDRSNIILCVMAW